MTTTPALPSASLLTPDAYLSLPSTAASTSHRSRSGRRRSRSHRRKGTWKKLLWVRQSYPDNYTDEDTFLDALQRNPRLRPYEFWPLVADTTVIVQQVCTMVLFVCCFSGIVQEKVSAFTVVCWGTVGTVGGWVLWDTWVGREENASKAEGEREAEEMNGLPTHSPGGDWRTMGANGNGQGLGLYRTSVPSTTMPTPRTGHSRQSSSGSLRFSYLAEQRDVSLQSLTIGAGAKAADRLSPPSAPPSPQSTMTPRAQQRLATAKSAILIYCALLGLSPILKSLTKSTTSDSIWAISFWLMCINIVFFDYGSGVGATFPASLSTNAALMASTVLASRLTSTAHVFSLTLFSIEVFGLFPVFRRYLRRTSWVGHLTLSWFLVMGASAGVALNFSDGGWAVALAGAVGGSALTGLAMGVCSWWLIGLQRYKNEIYGPWDPARPVIRRSY